MCLDKKTSIKKLISKALSKRLTTDPDSKRKMLDVRGFIDGMSADKDIRQRFTTADLGDIFNEADVGEAGKMELADMVDFVGKHISKSRVLALKVRSAILRNYKTEADYRTAFASICNETTKECEREAFTQYAEDLLQSSVTESDAIGIYTLFDVNEDGRVSIDDFVSFVSGQSNEAVNMLGGVDLEAIVDLRVSDGPSMDAEYLRLGYTQVIPKLQHGQKYDVAKQGSFTQGESLWFWRRKQGTCSGRFKPIIDIQLTAKEPSKHMVVNGYTALRGRIAKMCVWIKRANNSSEGKEALVDLSVTTGYSRDPADLIHLAPATGYVRVDANFAPNGLLTRSVDAFLWMLPMRSRTGEFDTNALTRISMAMSEEKSKEALVRMARIAIRNYVPYAEVKAEARPAPYRKGSGPTSAEQSASTAVAGGDGHGRHFNMSPNTMNSMSTKRERRYDFSNTFLTYDGSDTRLTKGQLGYMLKHVGCFVDSKDVAYLFKQFDYDQANTLTREEFAKEVCLTPYELDETAELMRAKILSRNTNFETLMDYDPDQNEDVGAERDSVSRETRLLSQVFSLVNSDKDGILSLREFQEMLSALEIYTTEEESRRLFKMMDMNGNDRVEESDFVAFMRKSNEVREKLAHRLRDGVNIFRRWLQRGDSSDPTGNRKLGAAVDNNSMLTNQRQWEELMTRREKLTDTRGHDFFDADDLRVTMSFLDHNVSPKCARWMLLLICPDGNGQARQEKLQEFMERSSRSLGTLLALLQRDVMKPVYDAYVEYRSARESNASDLGKFESAYNRLKREMMQEVQSAPVRGITPSDLGSNAEVVSVYQLKAGIEAAMRRYKEIDGVPPNVEEWGALSCLGGAAVAEDSLYGVRPNAFIEGICETIMASDEQSESNRTFDDGDISLDRLVREVQRLIREEASSAGKGLKMDYRAAFDLINTDGDDVLSIQELKQHLVRLQLSDMCPEVDMPKFMRMIDTTNKGFVTFDDFMRFVHENKDMAVGESHGDHYDADEGETDPARMSGTPPVAVTKNADCDFLLWFIWRQACRIEPGDPEGIVNELEGACTETELTQTNGTISIKELWNLMFELKIQTANNITKQQYEKGVRYLVHDPRDLEHGGHHNLDSHDIQVDYRTLTRYVIRMGRAHEVMVEEKKSTNETKYRQLKADLKRFLASMDGDHEVTGYTPREDLFSGTMAPREGSMVRFERVFRRLDSDGDGKITTHEFKVGLRRLGYKQERAWTVPIVKLLFAELDHDRDGTLSVQELSRLARDGDHSPRAQDEVEVDLDKFNHGDNEDDLFGKEIKAMSDSGMYYKVYNILKEMVPVYGSSSDTDAIKDAVRRFFNRSDTDNKGWVSEERFRAFLRRSSLSDKMMTSELRHLTMALTRRQMVKGPHGQSSLQTVVDYEKLVHAIEESAHSGPSTKSDLVLLKLRDAANASASAGRPFLSLCSLIDTTGSGRVFKDEMLLTFKMMGCNVSASDLESLKDEMLEGTIAQDGTIDYKEINYLLTKDTSARGTGPHGSSMLNMGPTSFARPQSQTSSYMPPPPAYEDRQEYVTPRGNLYDRLAATPIVTMGRTGGRTPLPPPGPGLSLRDPERDDLTYLLDKVRAAVDDKARKWSGRGAYTGNASENYSILRQMEILDPSMRGYLPIRDFVGVIEDLGVLLANQDIRLLQGHFEASDSVDCVAYEPFCRMVMTGSAGRPPAPQAVHPSAPTYLTSPRSLERFADLKAEGRNPRDLFEAYDLDVTGVVDVWRFKEVLQRINIIPADCINEAAMDFSGLGGRDTVSYDDFCRVLEVAANSAYAGAPQRDDREDRMYSRPRDSLERGRTVTRDRDYRERDNWGSARNSSRDPLDNDNVERWLTRSASPKQRREFEHIYDDLARFKEDQQRGTSYRDSRDRDRDFPLALDQSVESEGRRLRPPIISSSRDFEDRGRTRTPLGSGYAYERDSVNRSMERDRDSRMRSESPKPPRASPSKIGSKMWGSSTSLERKGQTPQIDTGLWTCPVCLYVENDNRSEKCLICNTPNYNNRPDFQVKEQCNNCTFLNGQYATVCEMCGMSLKGGKSVY